MLLRRAKINFCRRTNVEQEFCILLGGVIAAAADAPGGGCAVAATAFQDCAAGKIGRFQKVFASRIADRNYTPLISVKFFGNVCVHQLEKFSAALPWLASFSLPLLPLPVPPTKQLPSSSCTSLPVPFAANPFRPNWVMAN